MRARNTDVSVYADRIVSEIDTLLAAGVPPEHVAVVGHSKGGAIALRVSARLADDRVRYVILAGCAAWSFRGLSGPLHGQVLSIYERTDRVAGTCQSLFEKIPPASAAREIVLDVGGGHGLFFHPVAAWIEPTAAWAADREPVAPTSASGDAAASRR
jgi:pimeloyl-ACP methyl ester carboxylesterase